MKEIKKKLKRTGIYWNLLYLLYLSIETRLTKVKTIDKISNKKVYVTDKARVKQKNGCSITPIILTFNAALITINNDIPHY